MVEDVANKGEALALLVLADPMRSQTSTDFNKYVDDAIPEAVSRAVEPEVVLGTALAGGIASAPQHAALLGSNNLQDVRIGAAGLTGTAILGAGALASVQGPGKGKVGKEVAGAVAEHNAKKQVASTLAGSVGKPEAAFVMRTAAPAAVSVDDWGTLVLSSYSSSGRLRPIRNAHLAGKTHPDTGIPFDNEGYPDFSSVSIADVKIDYTGTRSGDYAAANRAAGFSKKPEGFTWHHHQDGTTMQLVPTDIHRQTGHTGGFSNP
ncbi:MAG: HNH endonuclease [Deltaproteobacteria bacterium]|nr:HNH endonuclease [Deltaproteobacteria bacterium]